MNVFSYRKHWRFLSPSQRRIWWDQKKRLTPRVKIGGAYVPPAITREFTYVKVSCVVIWLAGLIRNSTLVEIMVLCVTLG